MSDLKKLPHRDWEDVRDIWLGHLPSLRYLTRFPGPMLDDLPEFKSRYENAKHGDVLPYLIGMRESVFREGILLFRKQLYVRRLALEASCLGFPTWTAVLNYEASFFGARAVCHLLGIVGCGRHSKVYLDIFHQRIEKQGKSRNVVLDEVSVYSLGGHLTHKMLWSLFDRMMRTLRPVSEFAGVLASIKKIDFDKVSNTRNNLSYDAHYWFNLDDIDRCDLISIISDPLLYGSMRTGSAPLQLTTEYISVCAAISELLLGMLDSLASLAPALKSEVALGRNWQDGPSNYVSAAS